MEVESSVLNQNLDTMPKFLLSNARNFSDRPAFREKDLGIWQTWTWSDVYEEVMQFALGLQTLGLGRDDGIAIIGDNRPRLYWTFMAAQSLRALPVPAYQDSVADELAFVLQDANIKIVVAENQEQVDKILQLAEKVPSI
ncbi:MAG: AMP-binding protein, partial [Desulfobulbia bacterium]